MNGYNIERTLDFLRGGQFPRGGADTSNQVETPTPTQTRPTAQAKTGEKDEISKEREKELELWMEQVKAFIRKIDTNKL